MHKWKIPIIIVISMLLGFLFLFPILLSGNNLGIQDWDQEFAWTELNRISLVQYHQFPLWDPYKCGGTPQFGNPQIPVISFQTLFALLFGTVRGIKLGIYFHAVIGFIGFYLLAKQFKLSDLASLIAAALFSYSGITGSFLATGMVVFTSLAYTPYILYFFSKSLENLRWAILAGIFFAFSFYFGYQIPLLLGMFLCVYCLFVSVFTREMTALKALTIIMITAGFLMLPKLLLSIELLRVYPRLLNDESGYSVRNFFYFLLSQKQNLFNQMDIKDYSYAIDENSIYVGYLSFILFLLFFIRNKEGVKKYLPLVLTLFIFFWLMLGNTIFPSLYSTIRHLPVLSSFRVAQRFRFDFIIPFSLLAGLGLDNLRRLFQASKYSRLISILCFLMISIDLCIFSSRNFLSKTLIIENPETTLSSETNFIQTRTTRFDYEVEKTIQLPPEFMTSNIFIPWSDEYLKIIQNKGEVECYDPIPIRAFSRGVEDPGYLGEFHVVGSDTAEGIANSYWSPNKLEYTVLDPDIGIDGTLIINQNFYPGWVVQKNNEGCLKAIDKDGLLATRISRLDEIITLQFNPFLYNFICK
jgi:hypothetical protein